MKNFITEQEKFWAGEFGCAYIERNNDIKIAASNLSLFSCILSKTRDMHSVLEFGANIGLNLIAMRQLIPDLELSAIEINETAIEQLKKNKIEKIYHQSILEFKTDYPRDFVLSKGVMIHINPDYLQNVYDLLYQSSSKYICLCEYYNPTPVAIPYRGWNEKLYKRDFAGEMLDRYHDLMLIDYGFVYHKDPVFPGDDMTWFLIEKKHNGSAT